MSTITLKFDTNEQRDNFQSYLGKPLPTSNKGFAAQVLGLALFALAELEGGDVDAAKRTLTKISEIANSNC